MSSQKVAGAAAGMAGAVVDKKAIDNVRLLLNINNFDLEMPPMLNTQ